MVDGKSKLQRRDFIYILFMDQDENSCNGLKFGDGDGPNLCRVKK